MIKLLYCCLFFCCSSSFGSGLSQVSLLFTKPIPSTLVYGETLRIPLTMTWWTNLQNLIAQETWRLPPGSHIEYTGGNCHKLMASVEFNHLYICYINLVIPSGKENKTISGVITYDSCSSCPKSSRREHLFQSSYFAVTVIPHNISMRIIPVQEGTANAQFQFNIKSSINYYDENVKAGKTIYATITPMVQDGLRFDARNFAIIGKPTRIGNYTYKITVVTNDGLTSNTDLKIKIKANAYDKPVFKKHIQLTPALPDQKYSLYLPDLLEDKSSFGIKNQIAFRLDPNTIAPDWLTITHQNPVYLNGLVPLNCAGEEVKVTLIASSNTGGDSRPVTLLLPIAFDSAKKPVIRPFKLNQSAGTDFEQDLSIYLRKPILDPSIKFIIDKIQPEATWLNISLNNSKVLTGTIPSNVSGQTFKITLRAYNLTGGSSNSVTIPFHINTNKDLAPRFKSGNPILPMVYSGQPFFYDFIENKDIYPEYESIPYKIKFAHGYPHPEWLRIENNKLMSDMVPDNPGTVNSINLVINNLPGGSSKRVTLTLMSMN